MFDGEKFGADMVEIVRGYVERATAPILSENKALKENLATLQSRLEALEGRDETKAIERLVGETVRSSVASIPVPQDGKDADPEQIRSMVDEAVSAAISAIPPAENGKDGRDGVDGKDADPEVIRSLIGEAVAKAVAELPPAPRGERGEQGERGEKGADGKDGRDGIDGKDGAGIGDLMIDRDHNLVATFTDGRTKQLGIVVGKDGRDGKDGVPFGPDDIDMTLMEDGRTVRMAFTKGDTEYAFQIPFPVVIDRGVFVEGKEYEEADGVTWGGSFWIAQRATSAKPDSPESGWRLAVKRGRDGKDAR